ncbi:MAG: DUF3786 domain-containing protein [Anaerolineae bacterium]
MRPRSPEERYRPALERAREELSRRDPRITGWQSGADYYPDEGGGGHWALRFWGEEYHITYPEGQVCHAATGREPSIAEQILMLHYLLRADGNPMASRWIAFRELPEGLAYDAAFQQRGARRLAEVFGADISGFVAAARELGGERLDFGDASFLFRIFPRLWMAVVLHAADDEFGPSASILFDGAADHYLPTEDLAVLGGMLAGRLARAAGQAR